MRRERPAAPPTSRSSTDNPLSSSSSPAVIVERPGSSESCTFRGSPVAIPSCASCQILGRKVQSCLGGGPAHESPRVAPSYAPCVPRLVGRAAASPGPFETRLEVARSGRATLFGQANEAIGLRAVRRRQKFLAEGG